MKTETKLIEDSFPVLWGPHFVPRISYSLDFFLGLSLDSCSYSIQLHKHTYLYLPAGTAGEAPSQLSTFTEQEQEVKEVEDLIIQIESMKYEQIELCGFMTNFYYKDLNNR